MQAKVCDFVANCPYGDDESLCPPFEVFDECNSLEECHWTEESPDDDLNFVIKSIGNINKNVFFQPPGGTAVIFRNFAKCLYDHLVTCMQNTPAK